MHGDKVSVYIDETFGDVAYSGKFKSLIESSNHDLLDEIRSLGEDKNAERGILWGQHVDFFSPRLPEEQIRFEIPGLE